MTVKSCSQWKSFLVGRCCCRSSSNVYPWPSYILNPYQWFIKWLIFKREIIAEGKSLLSIVHAKTICANEFKTDLEKINNWSYQWKMSFNLDLIKVVFNRKAANLKLYILQYLVITMYLKPRLKNTLTLFLINVWHLKHILKWTKASVTKPTSTLMH